MFTTAAIKMWRLMTPVACFLLISSCKKPDIIPEPLFVESFAEVLVLKQTYADSTTAANKVQEYYASKNITREQMMQQLDEYTKDPDRYRRVLEKINARLRVMDSIAKISAPR